MYAVHPEWEDRFTLAVEDYLHGLISLVNELVRVHCFVYTDMILMKTFSLA